MWSVDEKFCLENNICCSVSCLYGFILKVNGRFMVEVTNRHESVEVFGFSFALSFFVTQQGDFSIILEQNKGNSGFRCKHSADSWNSVSARVQEIFAEQWNADVLWRYRPRAAWSESSRVWMDGCRRLWRTHAQRGRGDTSSSGPKIKQGPLSASQRPRCITWSLQGVALRLIGQASGSFLCPKRQQGRQCDSHKPLCQLK